MALDPRYHTMIPAKVAALEAGARYASEQRPPRSLGREPMAREGENGTTTSCPDAVQAKSNAGRGLPGRSGPCRQPGGSGDPAARGPGIRQFRQGKGLSWRPVPAHRPAAEMLAEVENATASPPWGCGQVGQGPGHALGHPHHRRRRPRLHRVRVNVRQENGRQASRRPARLHHETLAHHKTTLMEPSTVTLQPTGGKAAPRPTTARSSFYVLDGVMAAWWRTRWNSQPGDSIYYDSTVPHLLRPHGDQR